MWIFAFALLLIAIALLSRPGLLSKHPLTGNILSSAQGIVLQRGIAFVLMIPALLMHVLHFPSWGTFTGSALVSIGVIVVGVPFLTALITSRDKSDTHRKYFAGLHFGSRLWRTYVITTCFYMISYEILFRGILLHYLTDRIEVVYAIAINTLIYAVMHMVKNKREAILSVPLGILLCWLTVYTKSVWPAAFLHLVMALSFEFFYSTNLKYGKG